MALTTSAHLFWSQFPEAWTYWKLARTDSLPLGSLPCILSCLLPPTACSHVTHPAGQPVPRARTSEHAQTRQLSAPRSPTHRLSWNYCKSVITTRKAQLHGPHGLFSTQQPEWPFKPKSDQGTLLLKTLQWPCRSLESKPKSSQSPLGFYWVGTLHPLDALVPDPGPLAAYEHVTQALGLGPSLFFFFFWLESSFFPFC